MKPRPKQRGIPDGPVRPCTKRRYKDKIAALMALASTGHRTGSERRSKDERRAYHCPYCGGWHLTSRGPTAQFGGREVDQ